MSSQVNQQFDNAIKEFTAIEKLQEVQKAKHEKEEIHLEDVEKQVVQVIEQVEIQEEVSAPLQQDKAGSPSMVQVEPAHHTQDHSPDHGAKSEKNDKSLIANGIEEIIQDV